MSEDASPRAPSTRGCLQPLRVRVRGRALEGRREVLAYAEQRALAALDHLARRIECVAITVDTVDRGPETGTFLCHIWARLKSGRQLREECRDPDLHGAIDAAAESLARDVEYLESRWPPGKDLRCA